MSALVFRVREGDAAGETGEERGIVVVPFVLLCGDRLGAIGGSDEGGHSGQEVGGDSVLCRVSDWNASDRSRAVVGEGSMY